MAVAIPSAETKLKPKGKHGGARPGGGRPRTIPASEADAVEAARSKMRAALPAVVDFWLAGVRHGTPAGEPCTIRNHDCPGYRLRCTEQIAKRGGLPELQQVRQEVVNDQRPVLVFDFADPFPDATSDSTGPPQFSRPTATE